MSANDHKANETLYSCAPANVMTHNAIRDDVERFTDWRLKTINVKQLWKKLNVTGDDARKKWMRNKV